MVMDSMEYTFSRLEQRILETAEKTGGELYAALKEIAGPTLVCGCGGSSVVAAYLAEVLSRKNGIACVRAESRDVMHMDVRGWENVVAVSYGGRNLGVEAAFSNGLHKYLFSPNVREDARALKYAASEPERSYISVAATRGPMAALLMYYTDGDLGLLKEILASPEPEGELDPGTPVIEILTGDGSAAAAVLTESTLVESGMLAPVLHEKYNFCHGRINLGNALYTQLLYFRDDTELDGVMNEWNLPRYRHALVIDRRYEDPVVNDYWLSLQCMKLCRKLALRKGIDLSSIEECPENDRFYLFKGKM